MLGEIEFYRNYIIADRKSDNLFIENNKTTKSLILCANCGKIINK